MKGGGKMLRHFLWYFTCIILSTRNPHGGLFVRNHLMGGAFSKNGGFIVSLRYSFPFFASAVQALFSKQNSLLHYVLQFSAL